MRKLLWGMVLSATVTPGIAAPAAPPLPLPELISALRTHLTTLPESEFEATAAAALMERFRVRVVEPGEGGEPDPDAPALAARRRLDGPAAALRIGQVRLALAPQLAAALMDAGLMDGIHGLILDLRFATGSDYAAAVAAAALFLREPGPVLDWGEGPRAVPGRPEAFAGPVLVLVNRETSGAAEALAAILQRSRTALVIGQPTAGQAAVFREIPVPDGRRLRIPVAQVATGEGRAIPPTGLVPDILVRTQPAQERAYVEDPFKPAPGAASAAAARRKLTEADLVRARKEGIRPESLVSGGGTPSAPAGPVVHDPVLARALDLLHGLQLLTPPDTSGSAPPDAVPSPEE